MAYSGTGIIVMIIAFISRGKILFKIILFIMIVFFIFMDFFYKVSQIYIDYLFNYKINQITSTFENYTITNFILGKLTDTNYIGDFGWLYLISSFGFVGLAILIIFTIFNLNRNNALPISLLFLSTFHYPVLFFCIGQFIFAILLNNSYRSNL